MNNDLYNIYAYSMMIRWGRGVKVLGAVKHMRKYNSFVNTIINLQNKSTLKNTKYIEMFYNS